MIVSGASRSLNPAKSITSAIATAGYTPAAFTPSAGTKLVSVTTAVGGTLVTALNLSGRGRINYLAVRSINATAKTMRTRITVDGVVIMDVTTGSTSTSGNGSLYVDQSAPYGSIEYAASCLIEVCADVADSGGIAVNYTAVGL